MTQMNQSTHSYQVIDTGRVKGTSIWSNFAMRPPITQTRVEIASLQAAGYDYATDGHAEVFTIIYSEKESASLSEIETILQKTRTKVEGQSCP